MPKSSHQAFCQKVCIIYNTNSTDTPVTLHYLPFTLDETSWPFSEKTGRWHTSHWYHFHTPDNMGNNTYQLLKEHILGDPLCGSIEMKQQKHMSTDVLCKMWKLIAWFSTLQIIPTDGQTPPYVF